MRVRMLHQISGTRGAGVWPAPGEEIDVPADEAVSLIGNRMAVHVETPAVAETATTRRKPATRRKPVTD